MKDKRATLNYFDLQFSGLKSHIPKAVRVLVRDDGTDYITAFDKIWFFTFIIGVSL